MPGLALLLLLFAALAPAQPTPDVVYTNDFQSYRAERNPDGWSDYSISGSTANGLYKTWPDPTDGTNIVFGTKQSSGQPDGNHPKIGTFSILTTKTFAGRLEYQGRFIRTNSDTRIGLAFHATRNADNRLESFYLIGLWNTLQLFTSGGWQPAGRLDSGLTPEVNKWYRFAVVAEDTTAGTVIRARFWPDGTTEPATFSIDANDATPQRLARGHVGIWSAVRGAAYVDDLSAKSVLDFTPPVIAFLDAATQRVLDPAQLALFKAPARIEIRVTDDSAVNTTAKLDGNAYTSSAPIDVDGPHKLTVHAVDVRGNARDASLDLVVDQAPPVIGLRIDGAAFAPGAVFGADVTLSAVIQDASKTTVTALLDGTAVALPRPIAEERAHEIRVTAVDQLSWESTASSTFVVDKTSPSIAILGNGKELGGGESFQADVTLTWTATDLALDRVEATLNGTAIQSGTVVSSEAIHELVVKAWDKAAHVTTETRKFVVDKTAPEVRLLANGETFKPGTTFNAAVTFTVEARDLTPTKESATIDGQTYVVGTSYGPEGPHTVTVVVTNGGGLATTVGPASFTIDLTKPAVTLSESGEPFRDGMKFARDVKPVVAATDNLATSPERTLLLNGKPYPLDTPIAEEKADHVISATASDDGGNSASVGPFHFMLDKTKPVVTIVEADSGAPFAADALFARPVRVKVTVSDITKTTVAATLNDAPFDLSAPVAIDGTFTISVVATDEVGLKNDPVSARFTIDTTPPKITFTSPADGAVVATPRLDIAGGADDAVTITIDGRPAAVDPLAKTFLGQDIVLIEGPNTIRVTATDKAGNTGTAELRLELDTRAPEITVLAPAVDACLDATTLTVSGRVTDRRVTGVKVSSGSSSADAILDASNGTWTASIAVGEGRQLLTIAATDAAGHQTTITRSVSIDRTPPVLDVREGGVPFRSVSFTIRAGDDDPNVVLAAKLDGASYVSGTAITAEGAHQLEVSAADCAGHQTARTFAFTIDTTPPVIRNLNPANGSTVGQKPSSISGSIDSDGASIELLGTSRVVAPAPDGTFVLDSVPFGEGVNRFVLSAKDKAGNSAQTDYTVTVRSAAPVVSIRESGSPLEAGSLFAREVRPEITANDPAATIAATLNGASYASGTAISANGDYRLIATASDSLGHSTTAETTFSIDRTPPVVKIVSPLAGAVSSASVEVRGNAGDSVSADVNGIAVTVAGDGSFVLPSLTLDFGTTRIIASGRDRAGNAGRAEVEVTRDDTRPGIILTYPPDRSRTNRPTTMVLGRVLSPNPDGVVTIGSSFAPVDPTGAFRLTGYPLVEGENTITATTKTLAGATNSATVRVSADFTPPALAILESGQPLADGSRFAEKAVLSVQTSGEVTTELFVDGTKVAALPFTVTASGGHTAVAVARDLAGNETRVEQTFFVGTTGGGTTGCAIEALDPADGAVVLSPTATLVGRTGGAPGVKVNDVAASVADGSFRATVELPVEGANAITIRCADAAGAVFGNAVTITLHRVTGEPSITIATPEEGTVTASESVTITGTIGPGVVSVDVNGAPATISGTSYSVSKVRLVSGLNVLVARGRNGAGRVATASRRVVLLKNAPSIAISSPAAGTTTGATTIDVSGTFGNLDPATLVVTNLSTSTSTPAQSTRWSDTSGTFTATAVPLTSGEQTLRVSGRDAANREATANVMVRMIAGTPSIAIASPAAHTHFAPSSAASFEVAGTFQAAAGSTVEVNGVAANVSGSSFNATASFSQLGVTPVVARVTEPGGASASDLVLVTKLGAATKVLESFPAPNAVEIDAGALILVLFSAPVDRASLTAGFRLEDASGAPVSGTLFLDRDVLTFAPAALLTRGARYTLRVTTATKDLAGAALQSEWTAPFTIAASAPATPPTLTPITAAFCGQTVAVEGSASPAARLRLESGALVLSTTADAQGKFRFDLPVSGQSGYALVRVRVVGSDGSLSPAAELSFRVDCNGPHVLSATYDRGGTNKLTIRFSEGIDASTTGAISVAGTDGRAIAGTVTVSDDTVVLTPAEDLSAKSFVLTITNALRDRIGNRLATPYSQTFAIGTEQPAAGDGSGFIAGEIYDATTGRPLAGATISVEVPSTSFATTSDIRGRYLVRLPEGAHTIRATHAGYTSAWRQIVVPAGAGVVPIDIRLTKRGTGLTHGGDTAVTRRVELTGAAGAIVTSVGAQSLAGLLPLGWSPLASAEVVNDFVSASLVFTVPAADIVAATQNLTAVRYDETRDEWTVLAAVVNIVDGKVTIPINRPGAYALVYADKAPGLAVPPLATTGATLVGVPSPASQAPLVSRAFVLDPPVVLPNGRAVAALQIEGAGSATFPSGTAVQASIDEELRLADGSRLLDPPFATDLLLYRNLAGTAGVADFHIAPSPRAAQVILEIGFDHIRVIPYPGRLDRGTLIGQEGGRVPADGKVAIEIPNGATAEPLRATVVSLTQQELNTIGPIAGFRVAGGFALSLQRATPLPPQDLDGAAAQAPPVELLRSARATVHVSDPATQFILVELLDRMPRLAAQMTRVDAARVTTKPIDRSILPVDGIVREGRYVVLAAEAPIAFTTGTLRLGGALLAEARITANHHGVADVTRVDGIFNVPVLAKPAAPFTLTPRHSSSGDGVPYTHSAAPDPDAVIRVDLTLHRQPPRLAAVTVFAGDPPAPIQLTAGATASNVTLGTTVRATFSPSIDPASVHAASITVVDAITALPVGGKATAEGSVAVNWTLTPGQRLKPGHPYTIRFASDLRGTNGAALGSVAAYGFVTLKTIANAEVRRERITITIPDAQGVSRVTGDPGALPAGWQALAVRRGIAFLASHQATAGADGSFSFLAGSASDRVKLSDAIDLHVVNTAGNLAAIIPLTPFVTADRRGFIAPADEATTMTTVDGITVAVAAGTFAEPTMVKVAPAAKSAFEDIPNLDAEVEFAAAVKLDFEGTARKPLELSIPIPAGVETANRQFILALRANSIRGPRLVAVDTLRVANGKLTTMPDVGQTLLSVRTDKNVRPTEVLTGQDVKKYLSRVMKDGYFIANTIRVPAGGGVGWGTVDGVQGNYDIFWSSLTAFFMPHYYVVERGVVAIPIITGLPFTVVGVDASTGIQSFSKVYDPVPIGTLISTLPSPQTNAGGPYPVFAPPFRVETLDLSLAGVNLDTIRNFIVRLENDIVEVSRSTEPLPESTNVTLLNVTTGRSTSGTVRYPLALDAKRGDRIVLLVEQRDVDPGTPITVVFNEPIYVEGTEEDAIHDFLKPRVRLLKAASATAFTDITESARYTLDSGGRRLTVTLPSSLHRDSLYRLVLKETIADRGGSNGTAGLLLGQGARGIGGGDLHLELRVRKPGGTVGTFEIKTGAVRELALNGNVLFVSAGTGGLHAYDVADPASLDGTPAPLATAPISFAEFMALASDHHGRIYATTLGEVAGTLRSYRLEDFLGLGAGPCCPVYANSMINWRVGYSSSLGLLYQTIFSDRPESFPKKLQLLVQDDETIYDDLDEFITATHAQVVQQYDNGMVALNAILARDHFSPYLFQRITIENQTLDLRWSADASPSDYARFNGIIAGPNDRIRVLRNRTTYGVVSHLGYGLGMYDLNAMESNRFPNRPPDYLPISEQLYLTRGRNVAECFTDNDLEVPGEPAIRDIALSSDAAVRTEPGVEHVLVYAPEPNRGLLDLRLKPPTELDPRRRINAPVCGERGDYGLVLTALNPEFDHPRIKALKAAYQSASGGRPPYPHYFSVANYRWRLEAQDNKSGARMSVANMEVTRDYVVLAGGDLGLLVVEVGGNPPALHADAPPAYYPLKPEHLVDVIWIPTGALAVRTIPRTNLAVVVSRYGRVHLVDLSRIDERWKADGTSLPEDQLFPTAARALAGVATLPGGVGADDPRIVWTSEANVALGVLPPIVDPDTGMLYAGHVSQKVMKAVAAIDPRIQLKVDLGDVEGLSEVGGIVPHGIDPPQSILEKLDELPPCTGETPRCRENASLGTFRLEVSLPGAIAQALAASNGTLQIAIESERVANAVTEQTPAGFPRSHLRRFRRDGSPEAPNRAATHFRLRRVIPEDPELERKLRHQKGFNKFISPWIVGIADPRASAKYRWNGPATPEERAKAGCNSCVRPKSLENLSESDGVYELWTNGRLFVVRPEVIGTNDIFENTPYAYLGENNRFVARFATIMADTVRPNAIRVAGQNPPVADGAIQDTVYLHSGELEINTVDLQAGGRAGFDVVFDRTYRSRTLGGTVLGQGWESSIFRRLRALPSGEVELRDASGETWIFTPALDGGYDSPKGLTLNLFRSERGWILLDQEWRATGFDDLGRLQYESDQFAEDVSIGAGTNKGNAIRYLYDATGRLARIVDPVERSTELTYWDESEASIPGAYPGLLKQIKDWRGRIALYDYDAGGRLRTVKGPEFSELTGNNRPRTEYTYQPPAQELNDSIDFAGNLTAVKEPVEALKPNGLNRVALTYDAWDRLTNQKWATGESVKLTWHPNPPMVSSVDALGQRREYILTSIEDHDERAHIAEARVIGVPIVDVGAALPEVADVNRAPAIQNLVAKFTYNDHGLHTKIEHANGLVVENSWADPGDPGENRQRSIAPGMVLEKSKNSGPLIASPIETVMKFDTEPNHDTSRATVVAVGRDGEFQDQQNPSRERKTTSIQEDGVENVTVHNDQGLPTAVQTKDTKDQAVKEETRSDYFPADAPSLIARSQVKEAKSGDMSRFFEYSLLPNGGERTVITEPQRGLRMQTDLDAYGRTVRSIVESYGETLTDESFGYDASGQLVHHSRRQLGVGDVITRIQYDAMGRSTESSVTGAAVNGSPTTLVARTVHDVAARTTTEFDPAPAGAPSAKTVTTLDGLGRPRIVERTGTGGETVRIVTGFDKGGSASYQSDGKRIAVVTQFDARGRKVGSVDANGLRTLQTWDNWDEPREITARDSANAIVARAKNHFDRFGRLVATTNEIEDGKRARIAYRTSENGDRKQGTRVGEVPSIDTREPNGRVRVLQQIFDSAGRLTREVFGAADGAKSDPDQTFSVTEYLYEGGSSPKTVTVREPISGAQSKTTTELDALDRAVSIRIDDAEPTLITYDEAGNAIVTQAQGMKPTTAVYDSRGLVTASTDPAGGTIRSTYDALGNLRTYTDESNATTTYTTDGLGRVIRVDYPDGTSEETRYETGTATVAATRDRAGKWLSFAYGPGGRVEAVHAGETTIGTPRMLRYEYDKAGRTIAVRNPDAAITYEGFDLLGRPSITRTWRYANKSGLSDAPVVLDVHTQRHAWSVFDGERTSWRMPAAGQSPPETDSVVSPWLQTIVEEHDAASNLVKQSLASGAVLTTAVGRGAGTLSLRERPIGSASMKTTYGYSGDTAPPPPGITLPKTSTGKSLLMRYAATELAGRIVGGSANGRDAADRLERTHDLGLGNRISQWAYDPRGRLQRSWINMTGAPTDPRPPTTDEVTAGDFRTTRTIDPDSILSAPGRQALGSHAPNLVPMSWTATENSAHQLQTRDSHLDGQVRDARVYTFTGGRRASDNVWTSTFDDFGRLTSIVRKDNSRRIDYTFDPNDRVVGRTALRPGNPDWAVEDRDDILAADGLPAKTTFVWDPIADRLLAICEAGAANDAGLIRQYLHGDQGYDDPVRVLATDGAGGVRTYLPLIDEAGTGSLQAIVDAGSGAIVERVIYADAYGDRPRYLHGAVVDRISLSAQRSSDGKITAVAIDVHLSEALDEGSIVGGVHLASATAEGDVVFLSTARPALADPFTIRWALDALHWSALTTSGAPVLQISVTDTLRALRWGNTPVMDAPDWAAQVYGVGSAPHRPVVARQSFAAIESSASTNLYGPVDLYLVANSDSKARLFTGFKAAPFIEPATSLVYMRARWYDPATGSFLTPDPKGYRDSSNLYAAFANDPVNLSDPTGEAIPFLWAALAYLAWTGVNTAIDVGIDYVMEGKEFNFDRSLSTNLLWNAATGGFSKLKHVKHLSRGTKIVAETAVDVLATGATDMFIYDRSATEAFGTALVGNLVGRGIGAGIRGALNVGKAWKSREFARKGVSKGCGCLAAGTPIATPEGLQPIETIRVGDRVTSTNVANAPQDTSVDPQTWRKLVLSLPTTDGTDDVVLIEMLRPLAWIHEVRAAAGYWIDLRIPEMGIEGPAEVLSIEPCPPIPPGPGRAVLTTYIHYGRIVELRFDGHSEPVYATPTHLFYSEDRNAWLRTQLLRAGERIRTSDSAARIASIVLREGRELVFELGIETDHSYYAGDVALLSHNSDSEHKCKRLGRATVAQELAGYLTILGGWNSRITAVARVRHIESGKKQLWIATSHKGRGPPGTEYKKALLYLGLGNIYKGKNVDEHAEITILNALRGNAPLGDEWEILWGGTSGNICNNCARELMGKGLIVGGPEFDVKAPDTTPYRMFWKPGKRRK